VDSAPVLDKAWQQRQVLGMEKIQSNNPEGRLFYFIAELVVDLKLEYDHATTDLALVPLVWMLVLLRLSVSVCGRR
jgi:hypothetical protein